VISLRLRPERGDFTLPSGGFPHAREPRVVKSSCCLSERSKTIRDAPCSYANVVARGYDGAVRVSVALLNFAVDVDALHRRIEIRLADPRLVDRA
jgi:hypothetical protein